MISAFNCPHCNAYSHQKWGEIFFNNYQDNGPGFEHINDRILDFYKYFFAAICGRCSNYSIWNSRTKKVGDKSAARVYPRILTSLAPNQYMPDSAKGLYEEARMISGDSPRAAATLLRCAVEKVLDHLKIKKDNLYNRIGILVERKDLPETVYNALDIVRITGNDGAHSSQQIDMSGKDGKEIVDKLFWLVNFIVEKAIEEPAEIKSNFSKMPKDKVDGVKKRDDAK